MRTIPILVLILTVQFALAKKTSIDGTLQNNNYYDSIVLTEFTYDNPSSQTSAIDKKGSFSFETDVQHSNFYQLSLDEKTSLMLVLSPGEKITLELNAEDFSNDFSVKGSAQTELFYKASKQFNVFNFVRDSLALEYRKKNEELDRVQTEYAIDFIKKNSASLSSLLLIDKLSTEEYLDVYVMLDSSLRANHPENKIVQDFHTDVEKLTSQTLGFPIGDIKLKKADGTEASLASLKGKVVLIDFWATWCMPCKQEIPFIKKVYSKYNKQGFEVFSISIDRDRNRWLAEEKNMPWINVHDEKQEYANKFNVQSIPFTLLIDKEGRIVAKNVRGHALEPEVEKLLKQ